MERSDNPGRPSIRYRGSPGAASPVTPPLPQAAYLEGGTTNFHHFGAIESTALTASSLCYPTDTATSANPDLPGPDAPRRPPTPTVEAHPVSQISWRTRVALHLGASCIAE